MIKTSYKIKLCSIMEVLRREIIIRKVEKMKMKNNIKLIRSAHYNNTNLRQSMSEFCSVFVASSERLNFEN